MSTEAVATPKVGQRFKAALVRLFKALFEKKYLILHNPQGGPARRGVTFRTRVKRETENTYTVAIPLRVFTIEYEEDKIVLKNDPRIIDVETRYELF